MREAPMLPGLVHLQHLGSGGYAEVFLYEQQMPKMKVAVKVLNADSLDPRVTEQFTAEANTMAQLSDHPFIVPVMRADVTSDGRPYIVMKYYPQPNLSVRARRSQLAVAEVLKIGIQISSAVETAHRAGILHRDIKPANILTGQYGEPGLTDFGIAAATTDGDVQAEGMSIPWSPPEVIYGHSDGDVSADVYSLGATLWHLLAGRSPYEVTGEERGALPLMRRIQSDPVPSVPRSDVPESLQRLLRQALAKSPTGRPASALALARGLQAVEQEMHLSMTQIVLAEEEAPLTAPSGDDGDATRARGAQVVQAQPSLPQQPVSGPDSEPTRARGASPVPSGTAPAAEPRHRQPVPVTRNADHTVRRPTSTEPEVVPDLPPAAAAEPKGRGALAAALVVGVIVAVGVGVVLSGGSKTPPVDAPDEQEPGTSAVAPGAKEAPGTPTVKASRISPQVVLFTVTYANALSGDYVTWRRVDGVAPVEGTASGTELRLRSTPAKPACVVLRVQRKAGAVSSRESPVACK